MNHNNKIRLIVTQIRRRGSFLKRQVEEYAKHIRSRLATNRHLRLRKEHNEQEEEDPDADVGSILSARSLNQSNASSSTPNDPKHFKKMKVNSAKINEWDNLINWDNPDLN